MKKSLYVFVILLFSSMAFGQNTEAEKKTIEYDEQDIAKISQVKLKVKNKVSLPDAIKLMNKFIAKQKIDTSKYYLWRVQLGQVGSPDGRSTVWHFWWLSEMAMKFRKKAKQS